MKKVLALAIVLLLGLSVVTVAASFDAALREKKALLHTEFSNVKYVDLMIGSQLLDHDADLWENMLVDVGNMEVWCNPHLSESIESVGFGANLELEGSSDCPGCISSDITALTVEAAMHSSASGVPTAAFNNGGVSNYARGNALAFSKIIAPFYHEITKRYIGDNWYYQLREWSEEQGPTTYLEWLLNVCVNDCVAIDDIYMSKYLNKGTSAHNNYENIVTNKADKVWTATADGGEAAFVSSFYEDE